MKFFSGFALKNESQLFNFWLDNSEFSIAGFSYGAIKAFEYALNCKSRVDRLILISPAYFCNKSTRYKELQLKAYDSNTHIYIENFLQNISNKTDMSKYLNKHSKEELKELLYYNWQESDFKSLQERGVTIEVILAEKDKIIDSKKALEFFEPLATTYFIKSANHILEDISWQI